MRIVSDLIHSGALQYVDNVHIDWPKRMSVMKNGSYVPDIVHQNFK